VPVAVGMANTSAVAAIQHAVNSAL
jgi:hypothetical protein